MKKIFKNLILKIIPKIDETEYDYVWSSRKVIKSDNLYNEANSYYKEDIWGIAHNELKEHLQNGLTFYLEICGNLPNGGAIQSSKLGEFDYGCKSNEHVNYIYRIKYTNIKGKDFEFSAKQVQDFCKENGLNAVPELYYGYARDFYDEFVYATQEDFENKSEMKRLSDVDIEKWQQGFLNAVKEKYNEKDCYLCKNTKLPEEGCVVRVEGINCEVYKCKSFRFLHMESEELDKGKIDIESEN